MKKSKNKLEVDCGAACHVCPEHWMGTDEESDMRPLTLGAAGRSIDSAFGTTSSAFEGGRFQGNWNCLWFKMTDNQWPIFGVSGRTFA